jgi:hypothetical protein
LREKKIKEEGRIKQREKVRIVKRIQNLHLIKRVLIPAKQIRSSLFFAGAQLQTIIGITKHNQLNL